MTNFFKNDTKSTLIQNNRHQFNVYRTSRVTDMFWYLFYWYFDFKAQTRRFNIGIRLILVYWFKCTLKSILDSLMGCLTPAPLQNPQYYYNID